MDGDQIERYLREVGKYLNDQGLTGEILLVGGAYMTLVLRQRETTKDVDAYFSANAKAIREAAARVARENALPADWLNDAVKGFFHTQPEMKLWLECPGRSVSTLGGIVGRVGGLAVRPGPVAHPILGYPFRVSSQTAVVPLPGLAFAGLAAS